VGVERVFYCGWGFEAPHLLLSRKEYARLKERSVAPSFLASQPHNYRRAQPVPLLTRGFRTQWQLEDHFYDHCADFNVCGNNTQADMQRYEALADAFLGGPREATTRECIRRRDNALARYNSATEEYGVLSPDGYILTYYKPDPRLHRCADNLAYFQIDCRRVR
jgi:hypothetical protein